jgi:hypothetical protein
VLRARADRLWACDARAFDDFVEATRAEGERKFGEASDNFTLAVVRVAIPSPGAQPRDLLHR